MKYPRLPENFNRAKKLSYEDIEKAKRLRGRGATYQDIADIFGVTPSAILYHVDPSRKGKVRQNGAMERERRKDDIEYYDRKRKNTRDAKRYKRKVSAEYKKYLRERAKKKYYENLEKERARALKYYHSHKSK